MTHAPVLIPLVCFLSALFIPVLGGRAKTGAYVCALTGTGLALLLASAGLWHVTAVAPIRYFLGGWQPPIGIELLLDPLSAFLALVVASSAFLVLIHGRTVVERELPGKSVPFYGVSMLFIGGLLGIVLTADLFNLYVFLEISSLSGYALVALGDRRASVASFRYLILGTVGASFYLLGLGFVFIVSGSLNMADVAEILPLAGHSPALVTGFILMTLGMGLKMALFPMHGWLPDTYTFASSTATSLMAPIGTKVAAYVLLRLFYFVFGPEWRSLHLPLTILIGWLGMAGILWGSIMAIAQSDLKRMLAYSSIAQMGYIALGIGLDSKLGLTGAVLHILNHAWMKACLFLVAANFLARLGHTDLKRVEHSVRRDMPWTSAAFALAALSMIGLPPTAGFFSKWYLALGTIEKGQWIFLAAILISSLLNAVYFFRILERIYLRPPDSAAALEAEPKAVARTRTEVPSSMLAPTMIFAGGLLVFGMGNAYIVKHVVHRIAVNF